MSKRSEPSTMETHLLAIRVRNMTEPGLIYYKVSRLSALGQTSMLMVTPGRYPYTYFRERAAQGQSNFNCAQRWLGLCHSTRGVPRAALHSRSTLPGKCSKKSLSCPATAFHPEMDSPRALLACTLRRHL